MSTYAVVQLTLDMPSVVKLERAFKRAHGLTAHDAPTLAKSAFGILVHRLSYDHAYVLQSALKDEDIETQVIAESDLPVLPPTLFVNRLECTAASLLVSDSVNRPVEIPWSQVMLVSVGRFPVVEVIRQRLSGKSNRDNFAATSDVDGAISYESKQVHTRKTVVEVITRGAVPRVTILPERPVMFQYLEKRKSRNETDNVRSFLRDMAPFVPEAGWNRGARGLLASKAELMGFPSKDAFHQEMIWLLLKEAENGR